MKCQSLCYIKFLIRDIKLLAITNLRQLTTCVKEPFTFLNFGISICLNAGLRIGEVCALQWDVIDVMGFRSSWRHQLFFLHHYHSVCHPKNKSSTY